MVSHWPDSPTQALVTPPMSFLNMERLQALITSSPDYSADTLTCLPQTLSQPVHLAERTLHMRGSTSVSVTYYVTLSESLSLSEPLLFPSEKQED